MHHVQGKAQVGFRSPGVSIFVRLQADTVAHRARYNPGMTWPSAGVLLTEVPRVSVPSSNSAWEFRS